VLSGPILAHRSFTGPIFAPVGLMGPIVNVPRRRGPSGTCARQAQLGREGPADRGASLACRTPSDPKDPKGPGRKRLFA
jgi:hypothetical protein